jgi:hypothetical protein
MKMKLVEAQRAYLERLRAMRHREQQHMSKVDFEIFIKRFDDLLQRVESDLQALEANCQVAIPTQVSGVYTATYAPSIRYLTIDGSSESAPSVCPQSETFPVFVKLIEGVTSVIQKRTNHPSRIENAQISSQNASEPLRRSFIQRSVVSPQAA